MENKIWFVSDTHFGHQKEFLWGPRGFESSKEHDEAVIRNWNSVVAPEDIVYHLGDVMLGDNEYGLECLKRLNGKIHIISKTEHGNKQKGKNNRPEKRILPGKQQQNDCSYSPFNQAEQNQPGYSHRQWIDIQKQIRS